MYYTKVTADFLTPGKRAITETLNVFFYTEGAQVLQNIIKASQLEWKQQFPKHRGISGNCKVDKLVREGPLAPLRSEWTLRCCVFKAYH